ncbi:MAG: crotonobetainyl-CoA:carnitine CoA-transferase CaiB-like acyl-CoA transferase [Candidatus Azotimanducaceae bacterium]
MFIENFRAGLVASIGAGYEDIKASNPSIVYCSISGFGQHGSDAGKPAYTDIIQALSGLDHAASQMFGNETGVPPGFPASLADTYTSQQASIAILAALFRRQKTGKGEFIDISMLDCMISANDSTLQLYLFSDGELEGPSPIFRPPLKLKDGFLSASIGLNFEKTVRAIGLPELIDEELFSTPELRRENMVHYIDIVSGWAADKTVMEVVTLFNAHDIPYGEVRSPAEVINSDSTKDRQLVVDLNLNNGNTISVINTPFTFASGKSRPAGPPPRLGEHSKETLMELLTMTEADIQTLITNETIYKGIGTT